MFNGKNSMMPLPHKSFISLMCMLMIFVTFGCKTNSTSYEDEYLIKVGETVVTVGDYLKALEITKTAYSHSTLQKQDAFKKIQLRLLSQMAEELIIKKIAEEKKIVVTDEELRSAVDEIKKDYPDDVFEEILLENAISYTLWENQLKKRMLMKKVVTSELSSKINITPENMEEYYNNNSEELQTDLETDPEAVYARLVERIRLDKKQGAYQEWIDKKKADYSIEVNEKMWEKIIGS